MLPWIHVASSWILVPFSAVEPARWHPLLFAETLLLLPQQVRSILLRGFDQEIAELIGQDMKVSI